MTKSESLIRVGLVYLVASGAGGVWFFLGPSTGRLWLDGLLIDRGSDANFVPVNTADNWLHLVLGVGMIALGLLTGRADRAGRGPQAARGPGLG